MVFTVAEEVNQPDQASVLKGKQRRHFATGRKSKGAVSTLASSKAKESSSNKSGTKNNHSERTEYEMGNSSAQTSKNGPPACTGIESPKVIVEHVEMDSKPTTNNVAGRPAEQQQTANNGDEQTSEKTISETALIDDLESSSSAINIRDEKSEIAKLKQLLMLQVSLTSRQQDLLRLRDREIMQLKASNANYKLQLGRVRRRMSKRKSDADDSPKSVKRKSPESLPDAATHETIQSADTPSVSSLVAAQLQQTEEHGQKTKKRRLEYPEKIPEEAANVDPSVISSEQTMCALDPPGPSGIVATPLSDKVPVPVAFIERTQSELIHAMMVSPPDKAIKTFCEITNSSSPPLDEFPFKICDRCPHCVAIAQEITRLFKTAENAKSPELIQSVVVKPADKEIYNIAGIVFPSIDIEKGESNLEGSKLPILRTSFSYYRIPPTFDQNHWWWDLKCGDIKYESALKIPTWRETEIVPLPPDSGDEISEVVDDDAFMKRHSKLEHDEKRRKRWDIQRIREYRYNEKLRQKLLKQGTVYDSPIVESFSGQLHDALSVEVHDSLPVNVFGYPAPQLEPEEFDLTPMREYVQVGSKRKGRKM